MLSHPLYVLLTIGAVMAVMLMSEFGWRRGWLKGELGRKFVHIAIGTFVAFWPFFLDWNEIRLLSLGAFTGVVLSQWLGLFRAVRSVQRPTYGEVFFALAVGLLTLMTNSKGIYAAALLQMSLADGLAAVIGTRFGRDNSYYVLDNRKSVIGTATFLVVSLVLLVGYGAVTGNSLPVALLASTAVVAAALENVMPYGLDNLAVPLFIGWILTSL